jgi:hypothetical protein
MLTQEFIFDNLKRQLEADLNNQLTQEIADLTNEVHWFDVTRGKQLYQDEFLSDWIMISNYSAGDFGDRFIWPDKIWPEL